MRKIILGVFSVLSLLTLAACGDSAAVKNQFSSSSLNAQTAPSVSTKVETGADYLKNHPNQRQNNSGYKNEFYTDFVKPYWQLPKDEPTDNVVGFSKDDTHSLELLSYLTQGSDLQVNGKSVSLNVPKATSDDVSKGLKRLSKDTKYLETGMISNNYLAVAFFATKPAKEPTEIMIFQDTDFAGTDLSQLKFIKTIVVQ
jgi:hypothetical protein